MVEHQGSAPCIPVWKTGVYLSTPMLDGVARRAGAPRANAGMPCWNRTASWWPGRKHSCKPPSVLPRPTGQKLIESVGGSLHIHPHCSLLGLLEALGFCVVITP